MKGAPDGISVPRWSLSKTHLKGSRRAPSSTWRRQDASEAIKGSAVGISGILAGVDLRFIRVGKHPRDCSADNDQWETGRSASVVDPRATRPAIAFVTAYNFANI